MSARLPRAARTEAVASSATLWTRRGFLRATASVAGGLWLGWYQVGRAATVTPGDAHLGVFIRIEPDGTTVIGARTCEIGQGVKTSLPMLIAEELDADWNRVRVEQLDYGIVKTADGYGSKYGPQGAGGSTSVSESWVELRQIGARARSLLLQAAAARWGAGPQDLTTRPGFVVHPDGRTLGYGELAKRAAAAPFPTRDVPLKNPRDYRLIGTRVRTVDAHEIVSGRARYGLDANLPGALIAVVERCPYFSGGLVSFDASAARAVPGVRDVIVLPGPRAGEPLDENLAPGVAVIARDTWSALQGRRALKVQWSQGPYAHESSASLDAQCTKLLAGSGRRVRNDGDFDRARSAAARVVTARYRLPYVAHATLEPQNACVHVEPNRVRIIAPLQSPGGASRLASRITGVERLNVEVTLTRVGGGFGRRLENDFVAEALWISKLTGQPIKLLWTREDDFQHDWYRPFGHHDLTATLDAGGKVTGWAHRLASASKYYRQSDVKPDEMWTAELYPDDFPAALVPNLRYEWFAVDSGATRGNWRAPAHTANAFAVQSFVDELAHAAGQDPLALRLQMLGDARELPYGQHGGPVFDTGRLAEVLRRAATAVGWGRKPGPRRGIGLAAHFTFGGYTAHAIEVEADERNEYRIARCVCVVDVGRPVNLSGLEAQMMGGTIDGLSTARRLEVGIEGGRVTTRNFNDYPLLRINEAPNVEVIIVPSERDPSGAGEMGVPTAAPALANALFAATGVRTRSLPLVPLKKA
jgi:isoquinoline 1-oxidoreductase beta subunit